jgi:hypothetical protein
MATALEQAQARLDLYLQAEASILAGGQEGRINDRLWKKADLAEIRSTIQKLQAEIDGYRNQASGQSRLYTGVPR